VFFWHRPFKGRGRHGLAKFRILHPGPAVEARGCVHGAPSREDREALRSSVHPSSATPGAHANGRETGCPSNSINFTRSSIPLPCSCVRRIREVRFLSRRAIAQHFRGWGRKTPAALVGNTAVRSRSEQGGTDQPPSSPAARSFIWDSRRRQRWDA